MSSKDIAAMIKNGEEIRILDNKSKEDLTAVTFAKSFLKKREKVAENAPDATEKIIQKHWRCCIGEFLQKKLHDPVNQIRGDVEKRVTNLVKNEKTDEESQDTDTAESISTGQATDSSDNPDAQEEKEAKSVRAFVFSTTEAFDGLQERIDERVNKTLNTMSHTLAKLDEIWIFCGHRSSALKNTSIRRESRTKNGGH